MSNNSTNSNDSNLPAPSLYTPITTTSLSQPITFDTIANYNNFSKTHCPSHIYYSQSVIHNPHNHYSTHSSSVTPHISHSQSFTYNSHNCHSSLIKTRHASYQTSKQPSQFCQTSQSRQISQSLQTQQSHKTQQSHQPQQSN
ncbi:7789_t:CDS:2 [Dentiscutata erythropus]|uniref:7788_t:CDS:1 n=1 Tax=Dentiscutata erythropus TaxID=1348616 RepID=A0A9N9I7Y8_9GLOM|nr:7788_t:CDS:2 [Dentiscutata erythropus]CAG8724795.1 7789_t:CDS:2 [Dentiscutata erythropus]